jgi:hypothetical protein
VLSVRDSIRFSVVITSGAHRIGHVTRPSSALDSFSLPLMRARAREGGREHTAGKRQQDSTVTTAGAPPDANLRLGRTGSTRFHRLLFSSSAGLQKRKEIFIPSFACISCFHERLKIGRQTRPLLLYRVGRVWISDVGETHCQLGLTRASQNFILLLLLLSN